MRNMSARIGAALALAVLLGTAGALADPPTKDPSQGSTTDTKDPKKDTKKDTKKDPKKDPKKKGGDTPPPPPPEPVETAPAPVVEAPVEPEVEAVTSPTPVPVAPRSDDEWDVTEKDAQKYYFVGLRYRGQLIPQAFINIFVDGGATVWTNSIGLEVDIRKDGFSLIPNITFSDYGTGDLLFLQKNKVAADVGNWSMIKSNLKVLYFGSDFLWSVKIAKNFDFEYGLGFGIGVVFGDLYDDWVRVANKGDSFTLGGQPGTAAKDGNGAVAGFANHYYIPCKMTGPPGCNAGDHNNSSDIKVNNFADSHGFNPVPTLFFNVSIPYLGVRIKPIKSAEARIGFAFNIPNGFVFGMSGDYGLEKVLQKK